MVDNQNVDAAADYDVATDKVTYSGDADQNVQLMRPVHVTGSEGSKTVVDVTDDEGFVKSGIGPGFDRTVDATLGALNDTLTISTAGAAAVLFFAKEDGDLDGTINLQCSADDGVTWSNARPIHGGDGAALLDPGVGVDGSDLYAGDYLYTAVLNNAGDIYSTHYRVRVSAYTSGSVDFRAVAMTNSAWTQDAFPAVKLLAPTFLTQSPSYQLGTNNSALPVMGNVEHDSSEATIAGSHPVKIGGRAQATAPTDVADNDRVNAWFLRNGAQATVVTAAGALIGGDATNGLDVDVTRSALPTGAATSALQGGGLPSALASDRLKVDASGVAVPVTDNSGSLTVDAPSGTPVHVRIGDGTLQTSVVDETGSSAVDALAVGGGTPHDSVDSGNPQKIGFKANNVLPTAVANNDRANAISDLWGRQMTTHIDPAQQVHKAFNATTAQTGIAIWDPTAGKKIAITSIVVGTYGTTAGRIILWFGANGDTTYSAGTDQLVLAFSTAPSASSKPGMVFTPAVPVFCVTADHELHITTDAAVSIDVSVEGYEF